MTAAAQHLELKLDLASEAIKRVEDRRSALETNHRALLYADSEKVFDLRKEADINNLIVRHLKQEREDSYLQSIINMLKLQQKSSDLGKLSEKCCTAK